ncbi:MAG: enoyl-CoA hydratase/isomerase family protein [Acidobacteriota bacterium]|nr:enoyl-CoA hydratase/isomerase family protein [Acidobacteriota bacterium]
MLIVETDGQVRHLRLNRPEKRNALSFELCRQLTAALDIADQDPSIHAILLTAEGPAFCAGMDLKEIGLVNEADLSLIHDSLFTAGSRLSKPLIAAVAGPAIAGGTGLAANAHIVVAGPDATFGLPEIKIGLWPLLVFRAVAQAVGERRATELSLTGRRFTAAEANWMGLVTEVHEAAELRAKELAATVAGFRREAVSLGLEYVRESRTRTWEESGQRARVLRAQLLGSS